MHLVGLLQPLAILQQMWTNISIDFGEGLPVLKGYSVVMVVVDKLFKYAHFLALKHPFMTAKSLKNLFRFCGMPKSILSDRGSTFISSF